MNQYAILSIFALVLAVCAAKTIQTDDYVIWSTPEGATNVDIASTNSGAALIGGGEFCIPAFNWMIRNANGGDCVVLRVGGEDVYNDFIYQQSVSINATLNSVSTISFLNKNAAYDTTVQSLLKNAEMIFFAGGDQSEYLNLWANTPVQEIIQEKLATTTIGGTSAGLAILGQYIYSAAEGTVYSDESMENPYNKFVTFADAFLKIPYLQGTITDTHFGARDRMGRYLSFIGRLMTENSNSVKGVSPILGVALDEETALLLDIKTGEATAVGNGDGHAYLCSSSQLPEVCKPATPLTYSNIHCTRMSAKANEIYNFQTRSTNQGVSFINGIKDGKYTTTTPYGP